MTTAMTILANTACDSTSWPDALITVVLIIAGAAVAIFVARALFS